MTFRDFLEAELEKFTGSCALVRSQARANFLNAVDIEHHKRADNLVNFGKFYHTTDPCTSPSNENQDSSAGSSTCSADGAGSPMSR